MQVILRPRPRQHRKVTNLVAPTALYYMVEKCSMEMVRSGLLGFRVEGGCLEWWCLGQGHCSPSEEGANSLAPKRHTRFTSFHQIKKKFCFPFVNRRLSFVKGIVAIIKYHHDDIYLRRKLTLKMNKVTSLSQRHAFQNHKLWSDRFFP